MPLGHYIYVYIYIYILVFPPVQRTGEQIYLMVLTNITLDIPPKYKHIMHLIEKADYVVIIKLKMSSFDI